MKELSIEERARRYDEALERAKEKYAMFEGMKQGDVLEDVFPELKDSNNEQIRKALIQNLKERFGTKGTMGGILDMPKVLAWLEKQGGEQNLTLPKWKYKNDNTPLLRDSIILNKYGCVAKSPSGALVSDVWVIDYDELAKLPKEEIEKQGEQKPADKIEPFNEYEGLTDFERTLTDICIGWIGEELGWKQYVKDNADVLLKIAIEKFNSVQDVPFEQKPAWSEEDVAMLDSAIAFVEHSAFTTIGKGKGGVVAWLKSLKERYAWKPNDGQMTALNYVVNIMASSEKPIENDYYYNVFKDLREQLKKLKEE